MHNYLGLEGTAPRELLERGRAELRSYGGQVRHARVVDADRRPDGIELALDDGTALLLERGYERYFADDYISACHVLVPRVEDVLRRELGRMGVETTQFQSGDESTSSRTDDATFGALLYRSTADAWTVKDLIGPPLFNYVQALFTSPTSLNLRNEFAHHGKPDLEAWWRQIDAWRSTFPLGNDETDDGHLAPQHVISRIGEITGPEAVYVAGVGQHQMWAAQFIRYQRPRSWLNSGGLGTMGYAVPAAMGAKVGAPDRTVWAIDGDGCFQMTNQELATCTIEGIPIKVAIINNESLGMVRQWQTLFYNSRYSNTDLQSKRIPDFVKLAEAYGCVGLACESPDDVDATIAKAMEINDVPVVVDFRVHRDAMVWPMVAAGTSNDDIKYARDLAPQFDEDDL